MLDVAALAGVGLKTVSRVVNSERGVSPELEARVREAIDQLSYRRDANAATLRRLGRKTQTIGLVLEDVSNPFSSALHRGVEDAARERGVRVFRSRDLHAQCSCSRERVERMLRSFSQDDRDHMVENGKITVTCEFCNTTYTFEPLDVSESTPSS